MHTAHSTQHTALSTQHTAHSTQHTARLGVMSNWSGYTQRSPLPRDWASRVRAVRRRAHNQCEAVIGGNRCQSIGSECHHAGEPDNHRIDQLQWLCAECHNVETQKQAYEGNIRQRARAMHPMQRRRYLKEKLGTEQMPENRRGGF